MDFKLVTKNVYLLFKILWFYPSPFKRMVALDSVLSSPPLPTIIGSEQSEVGLLFYLCFDSFQHQNLGRLKPNLIKRGIIFIVTAVVIFKIHKKSKVAWFLFFRIPIKCSKM